MTKIKIQNRVKELRKSFNLTLQELSDKTGIAKTTLSNYERGVANPKIDNAEKIANALEVPTPYVLGLTNEVEKTVDVYNNGSPIPNDVVELGTGEFGSLVERVKIIAKKSKREKKLKEAVDEYLGRETTEDEFAGVPLYIDMIGTEIHEHLQWIILISAIDKSITKNKIEYLEKEIQKLKKK